MRRLQRRGNKRLFVSGRKREIFQGQMGLTGTSASDGMRKLARRKVKASSQRMRKMEKSSQQEMKGEGSRKQISKWRGADEDEELLAPTNAVGEGAMRRLMIPNWQ